LTTPIFPWGDNRPTRRQRLIVALVVTLVATNYGLFAPTGEGFAVKELAPGITFEAAQAATGAPLTEGR